MWKDIFERYKGMMVAVWCARYTYRGRVEEIGIEVVTLTNARAVEQAGSATAEQTTAEDPIPSDLHISYQAIEIVCRPSWVDHE